MPRHRIPHAWLALCVFFLGGPPFALRAADPVLEAMWREAEARELWNDPVWWTLGHYHRTLWGRVASRIDDPRFFLHPEGKTDRRSELRATLEAFRSPPEAKEGEEGSERSAACRFPARRRWLLEALDLPPELFPGGDCEEYLRAVAQLRIDSATMIYPAAYLNSPASMFGHLLLVLDREGKDRLLSRAVNYAAIVEDTFGPLFAVKGIFGLYDGVFAVLPYYDKVEEYSAVNRRDIWEYPLELNPEELDCLLRHVWELQEIRSRYFFFKENCAFNLLYPVEAGRPDIGLTRRFRLGAVPVSLLRELAAAGVTGEPRFRPSKATRMEALADSLSRDQLDRVEALVEGAEPDGDETAVMMNLAFEWVQFRYTEQDIPPEAYRERVYPLLRARSRLGREASPSPIPPAPPHAGHGPRRLQPYVGVETTGGESVAGVRLRAAYHDWLDDPRGYPEGSAITLFEIDLRAETSSGRVALEEFTLVEIRSLTPPKPWVRPLSWAVEAGVEASPLDRDHHRTVGRFASGFTRQVAGVTGYVMGGNVLRWDSALEENVAWEPGVEWGLVATGRRVRGGVRGREMWGVWGADGHRRELEGELRFGFGPDHGLGLAVSRRRELHRTRNLVTLEYTRTF